MITLGMDPHPGSHTVAALDSNGSLRQQVLSNCIRSRRNLRLVAGP